MYVLDSSNLIFLAQPRTASRSVAQALLARGAQRFGEHHTIDWARVEYARDHGWMIVSGIRHHLDAIVSWWTRGAIDPLYPPPIEEYWRHMMRDAPADSPYFRPHSLYWLTRASSNRTLRYESLEDDWRQLCEHTDMTYTKLSLVQDDTSWRKKMPYQEAYTSEFMAEVRSYYWHEMKTFGYT